MKNFVSKFALALSLFAASFVSADHVYDYSVNDPCCNPSDDCVGFNLYIGGNVGVASHIGYRNDLDGFLTDNAGWAATTTGVTGGGQLGLDLQRCNFLVGVVADWNKLGGHIRIEDNPNVVNSGNVITADVDWLVTVRLRAGLTVGNALVYITGGGAKAKFHTTWQDAPVEFKKDNDQWGWTGGAGTSYDLGCNFSIGAEVLFAHFDDKVQTFVDPNDANVLYSFGQSNSMWLGKIMLNYNFGDFSQFGRR